MNPAKWIRWKVLIALALVGGLLYFLGIDPLARWQINDLGSVNSKARWQVGGVDLGFLSGDFELAKFLLATADAAQDDATEPDADGMKKREVLGAELASFDLNMNDFLKKRVVVDKVEINTPKMRVERRPDGSTNIGDLGEEDTDEEVEAGESKDAADWIETAKKWYERIQKVRKRLPGKGEEEGGEPGEQEDYYSSRATYPFAGRPGVVIKKVVADGLEIDFVESDGSTPPPPLKNGSLALTGLSNRPTLHEEPIKLSLSGDIEGAQVSLDAVVDLTTEPALYGVKFDTGHLPVSVVEAFVGASLPVRLVEGSLGLTADLELFGDENLRVTPVLLFQGVKLETKASSSTVAGVDAAQFVNAFNEASDSLGSAPLTIADLKILGTLSSPRFEWGDTVKNLVLDGGKAFARKQLGELEEKAQETLRKEADKIIEKGLKDVPIDSEIRKSLEGLIPGSSGSKDKAEDSDSDAKKDNVDDIKNDLFRRFGSGKESPPEKK